VFIVVINNTRPIGSKIVHVTQGDFWTLKLYNNGFVVAVV